MMDSFTVEYKKVSDVLRPPILLGGFFIFFVFITNIPSILQVGREMPFKCKSGVRVPI